MKRPYCVGLTGGIGSGKGLVAGLFSRFGAGVIDTDIIARELTAADGLAMARIREAFGPDYVAPDGSLDRSRMREQVFSDPRARQRLEAILHPLIRLRVRESLSASDAPYVLLVVPLLLETSAYAEMVDRILVVDCEPDQQIERVISRDRVSDAMVRAIMAAQFSRAARLATADDVIDNSGAPADLEAQVGVLHQSYMQAACGIKQVQALQ